MKESYPVQVAEYTIAKGIANKPAFSWSVSYSTKKRNVIISEIKSRLKVATHEYGFFVEILSSIEHAIRLDAINGN